ncbi:hypothetical protein BKA70DRAFT_1457013 [Coprinopsis sp. MPI-PUGE-AT-0042]|nr:hypothetical protein BKA70DRAFT_1457013 [Coprinopsis sp. MPI-PUGE-AT-0042]
MSHPTPLRSFLGGLSLPLPVHSLLLLNGNVFGISGFVHRAVKGSLEGAAGVIGLGLGGVLVAMLDRAAPNALPLLLPKVALAGFLVGFGTKLANGCTSGHMICGLSRFSIRSLAATLTFFATGALTAQVLQSDSFPAATSLDWTLGPSGAKYFAAQALPLVTSAALYAWGSATNASGALGCGPKQKRVDAPPNPILRALGFLNASLHFALAVHLSNLTDASRVLAFLLLPFNHAFDPSLAFLAAGALPFAIVLYRYARGTTAPKLGGKCSIPQGGQIDLRLIAGSAIFGIGWGIAGICPGPAIVNLGRGVASGANASQYALWLVSMIAGSEDP